MSKPQLNISFTNKIQVKKARSFVFCQKNCQFEYMHKECFYLVISQTLVRDVGKRSFLGVSVTKSIEMSCFNLSLHTMSFYFFYSNWPIMQH